jgi:hypothetical protein
MIFFSEDFTFTDIQRVSNKRVLKFTKRAQIIRIKIVKIKKAKIHEESIDFLISLNYETTLFEQENALFVNKHVSSQTNHIDSLNNVFSFTNLNIANFNISNQNSYKSFVVVAFVLILAIIFNILDTFLSLSFIDSASLFLIENLLSQITTITLQTSFERVRREVRQRIKNVYSYDSIINQIIKSLFNNAFLARMLNHLLFYLFTTINI